MKKKIIIIGVIAVVVAALVLAIVLLGDKENKNEDQYTQDNKLIISLRNLYFSDWAGGDTYLAALEEKFGVSITPTNYSWPDWDSQVYGPVNSDNLTDVFHFSLDSYNYANSYESWVKGQVIKALPEDLSPWPNLEAMLNNTSNIDSLKVDGKLYCIPIAKDIDQYETTYSPFTYVYRRDWAKELGVYQEGDVYTWEQFNTLLRAFYENKCGSGDFVALADVEWGFPSITNFYKNAPHCFSLDESTGKFVCTYTTAEYMAGLEQAKIWSDNNYNIYGYDQYAAKDGDVAKQYYAGRVGVFYENLSLSNYTTLRKKVGENPAFDTVDKLNDATAIMKVSGPDGKYVLEGTENWFSATFFSADISDVKMHKLLDIFDWLLSEEGTAMATYGIKDYDYSVDATGKITLLEAGWEKDIDGNYVDKLNGVKYLRYMVTLGYDTNANDPLVDKASLAILDDWYAFMDQQLSEGNLRVLTEDGSVKWMSTPTKSAHSGTLLSKANATVVKYVYGNITLDEYKNDFETNFWTNTLAEINQKLGK